MSRVLLVGAGGMLAHDILTQTPGDVEIVPLTSRELDVTNRDAVESAIDSIAPDVMMNCAAYTDVDGAESNRERAFAVNGEAPGLIASALARRRPLPGRPEPLLIHYSTDYVFDGSGSRPYREDDPCTPLGVYGASKLAGERKIAEQGGRYIILRTQWLYGIHGRSFPRTMWERAVRRQATKVVNDQTGRPTYTVDLARTTWQLLAGDSQHSASIESDCSGRILHAANAGSVTWYQIAQHVFRRAGALDMLTPCTTADFPRPARRPVWSVLDTTRLEAIIDPLPRWDDALDRFLDEIE